MHISKVIKILDENSKPQSDVICTGCVNGVWRYEKEKSNPIGEKIVSCYCKIFYKETYNTRDTYITTDCDGFSDQLPSQD